VQDAYRGLIMTNRYPVAFLFLELPSDQIDVNVHPTKSEVRFREKDRLYQLIQKAVRSCLQEADLTARMRPGKKDRQNTLEGSSPPVPSSAKTVPIVGEDRGPLQRPVEMPSAARILPPVPATQPVLKKQTEFPGPARNASPTVPSMPESLFTPAREERQPDQVMGRAGESSSLPVQRGMTPKAIQVLDCYLVVETSPDEVLFIDQHALHERILFEAFQQQFRSRTLEIQRLLIPETINLPAVQAALVLEHREALAELGLPVEDFGGGTLILTGYPALLGKRSPKAVLQAVVDQLVSKERMPSRDQFLNDLISLMACHSAVRAGDRLTSQEIAALLDQRDLALDSHHCPHGRPTSLRFSRHDLEKQFRRT
jgi:DNA mismatch repair protein MutL